MLLPFGPHYMGDLVALSIVLLAHVLCAWILWQWTEAPAWLRRPGWLQRAWPGRVIPPVFGLSGAVVVLGFSLRFARVNHYFPLWFAGWGRGIVMAWAFLSVLLTAALMLSLLLPRVQSHHSPARRSFLRAARGVLFGVPTMITGYGVFIQRFRISVREQKIVIPGLPPDLDGLRLVQVTDIHLSPFLSEKELAHAVDLANEARGHLMLVTGDLITTEADPLDACLAQLSRLRAEAGVFGCNGNHETYTRTEDYIERAGARFGLRMLRSRAELLRFGAAKLNLAGVDYQNSRKPYLRGAQHLLDPDSFNVLLSHNPDVFPVAARQGYPLTIAGHTHGGQVKVEILHHDLNIARFFTPYVDGLYRLARRPGGKWVDADAEISPTELAHTRPEDAAVIFVSRGIGTIGLPARIGAPPEVALLQLCRI